MNNTERKCKKCGCQKFYASQDSTIGVEVNSSNEVIEDMKNTYSAEAPYGPYECANCHEKYDNLEELDDGYVKPEDYISIDTIRKYINLKGVICPFCGSQNMTTDELEFVEPGIEHYVKCCACEKEWYDVYTLTSMKRC